MAVTVAKSPQEPQPVFGSATIALSVILLITVWRIGVLFATPLGLYPEEAQYWLWSRELAFGYFSKPPMIAWVIATTTALGGNGEAFVRLAAPLSHAVTALAVMGIGRHVYGVREGALAALLYILMPAVALSSLLIATDAPLLAFMSLSLLAYVRLQTARGRARLAWALGFGGALGLAFLSKYAALYWIAGVAIHLIWSREARRAWPLAAVAAALAGFFVVVSPNIAWNLSHGLATVAHTASNAGLDSAQHFQLAPLGEFIGGQFGVFGPIPFGLLIGGGVLLAWRRRLQASDKMMIAFVAPPLAVITVQAFVTQANANWAAVAYVPASVLVAAWLLRFEPRSRIWTWITLGLQAAVAIAFLVLVTRPGWADAAGLSNSLKRARGWEQMTQLIVERARLEAGGGPLTAVVVQDRFTFNSAAYYGRNAFGQDLPPLRMWVRGAAPRNQAEAVAALTPDLGGRVLIVSLDPAETPLMMADFRTIRARQFITVRLDRRHSRRAEMFVAEGFAPRPRGPAPVAVLPPP